MDLKGRSNCLADAGPIGGRKRSGGSRRVFHGHGLDELSEKHLQHTPIKFSDVAGNGRTQVSFDQIALDKARDYAAEDADITLRLHQLLKPRLCAERLVTMYETIERPLIPIVADMEMAGVKHPAPSYQGREVVTMRGRSFYPWTVGQADRIHPEDFIQGWETCGRAALRWPAVPRGSRRRQRSARGRRGRRSRGTTERSR